MDNKYIINKVRSKCICGISVEMLAPKSMNTKYPWFYICWNCHRIFWIGHGIIERDNNKLESSTESYEITDHGDSVWPK